MKKSKTKNNPSNYKISGLCAIIPSYKGVYPLDIVPSSDLIILRKNIPVQINAHTQLKWVGQQDAIEFSKRFLYFDTSSVQNNFPKDISPKYKPRLDIIRKQNKMLVYSKKKNPEDFMKLEKKKGCAHLCLIPFTEFIEGKFQNVFGLFELDRVLYLGKHEDIDTSFVSCQDNELDNILSSEVDKEDSNSLHSPSEMNDTMVYSDFSFDSFEFDNTLFDNKKRKTESEDRQQVVSSKKPKKECSSDEQISIEIPNLSQFIDPSVSHNEDHDRSLYHFNNHDRMHHYNNHDHELFDDFFSSNTSDFSSDVSSTDVSPHHNNNGDDIFIDFFNDHDYFTDSLRHPLSNIEDSSYSSSPASSEDNSSHFTPNLFSSVRVSPLSNQQMDEINMKFSSFITNSSSHKPPDPIPLLDIIIIPFSLLTFSFSLSWALCSFYSNFYLSYLFQSSLSLFCGKLSHLGKNHSFHKLY